MPFHDPTLDHKQGQHNGETGLKKATQAKQRQTHATPRRQTKSKHWVKVAHKTKNKMHKQCKHSKQGNKGQQEKQEAKHCQQKTKQTPTKTKSTKIETKASSKQQKANTKTEHKETTRCKTKQHTDKKGKNRRLKEKGNTKATQCEQQGKQAHTVHTRQNRKTYQHIQGVPSK